MRSIVGYARTDANKGMGAENKGAEDTGDEWWRTDPPLMVLLGSHRGAKSREE